MLKNILIFLALMPLVIQEDEQPPRVQGNPVANFQASTVAFGPALNTSINFEVLWTHQVHVAGASSLRVLFDQLSLGPLDKLRISSPLNGEVQELTATEALKWQNSSAFFNGDKLDLELTVAPGSTVDVSLAGLFVGAVGVYSPELICGADNRVTATDTRITRLIDTAVATQSVCTGFLISADSWGLTAGHCFAFATLAIAEFNVPPSLSNGALVHPPVVDQFPIDQSNIQFSLAGIGFDWGLFRLLPNTMGQDAAAIHGHFNLATTIPGLNSTISVTGYGSDSGADNHALQTDAGPLTVHNGSLLGYQVDITSGSSGGPIIDVASGDVIGVHTNGGCSGFPGYNSGSSILNPNVQVLVPLLTNQIPGPLTTAFSSNRSTTIVGTPLQFRDESTGVPTSRSWDFDGDGITDSTSAETSFVWTTPGTYDVSLTVNNSFGTNVLTKVGEVVVLTRAPVRAPYTQDFSLGLPIDGAWGFDSDNFFGQLSAGNSGTSSPVSGGLALVMDSFRTSTFSVNEAILHVDLAATNGAILEYYYKETDDEDDPEDGLFLSDGAAEIMLQSHNSGSQTWVQFTVDISAAAATAAMTLTNDMQLIFRQRDNYSIGGDGILVDDIALKQHEIGQANRADASLTMTGNLNASGQTPGSHENGPFFLTTVLGSKIEFQCVSSPNVPFQLLYGPLNRGSFISFAGSLDISLVGWPIFADVGTLMDGFNPVGLLDFGAHTGPAGVQTPSFFIPAVFAPGVLTTFQALFASPSGLRLSAAVELTLQ